MDNFPKILRNTAFSAGGGGELHKFTFVVTAALQLT